MIPKILVLTDDQDDGVFIKDVLAEYSVLSATNAKDMEQILVSEEINLVIVDLRCTNRDGLKVLHALQKFSGRRRVPFLYLTGPQMGEAEAEGMKQGAADCLRKPLIREVLLARVRLHLELQQQFAANRELDEHVTLMDAVFVQAPIGIAINLNRLPDSGQDAEVFVNPMYEQIIMLPRTETRTEKNKL